MLRIKSLIVFNQLLNSLFALFCLVNIGRCAEVDMSRVQLTNGRASATFSFNYFAHEIVQYEGEMAQTWKASDRIVKAKGYIDGLKFDVIQDIIRVSGGEAVDETPIADTLPDGTWRDHMIYSGQWGAIFNPSPINMPHRKPQLTYGERGEKKDQFAACGSGKTPYDSNFRIFSLCFGSDRPYYELIKSPQTKIVSTKQEICANRSCVYVEIDSQYGKYKLWLDPECGFLPRRIWIEQGKKDLDENGLPLYDPPTAEKIEDLKKMGGNIVPPLTHNVYDYTDACIENLGESFFLTALKENLDTEFEDGSRRKLSLSEKVDNLQINPDTNLIKPFDLSFIPDGTLVSYLNNPYIKYEWREGKIMPMVNDGYVKGVEDITVKVKSTELQMNRPDASTNGVATVQSTKTDIATTSKNVIKAPQKPEYPQGHRYLYQLLACLGITAVVFIVINRRRKNTK